MKASSKTKYEAFVVLSDKKDDVWYNEIQIDAMFASYRTKLKTVNAYTSFSPPEFGNFWWQHNRKGLREWLNFKGIDSTKVLVIYK